MAEDIGFCQEMISTILKQRVIVKRVTPQNSIKNLQGRSVVLDALCVLENGKECNVEVQKADDDDHVIRETGEMQDNGLQEIYVNTKIDDGTDIAELMRVFSEKDAYDFEKFPMTSKRKNNLKQVKEAEQK